ncbi:76a1449b-6009-4ed4-a5c4-92b6300443d1 [Sclerotinia trifoliorum]|uniref:76a1449b-6009-4ed4-a5c4-92b6300443d1 n=1 Tax=Sclerotinia trifoliorum TaxID=28548 RepID=A0A8H2ZQN5_9HELO|nr:76a1449b-6009-4ed4-a5c4-92b6300443d1 [Sclerotinia trifoliorum]
MTAGAEVVKPDKPDKRRPETPQEQAIPPPISAPKRLKLAFQPHSTTSSSFVTTPEPIEEDSDVVLSPGHAPGYIQWKQAPVPDLTNETEEEKKHRLNKRHAPKGKRGARYIDDGTTDRSPAVLGKPDNSKLVIRFKTEETDEYTNEVVESDVRFEYSDDAKGVQVDWNSAKSIHALNNWRSQLTRRAIGKAYDNKEFWTVQEQQILTALIRDYLDGGKDIDWMQIAREYNSLVRNIEQEKGTPGAPRRYRCQGNDKSSREAVSISMPLRENRRIPQRSDWVIRQEISYFRAPDAIEVMERLRASILPQRNGHPPIRSIRGKKQPARQSRSKSTVRESSEDQDDSHVSSAYENDRSLVESPMETTPNHPKHLLTQPRPLQPRPVAIPQSKPEPPPRQYKKRNVYNEEIVYDKPSEELDRSSTNPNAKRLFGGKQQALDLLADQAAIKCNHFPEANQRTALRLIAPGPAPGPASELIILRPIIPRTIPAATNSPYPTSRVQAQKPITSITPLTPKAFTPRQPITSSSPACRPSGPSHRHRPNLSQSE